MRLEEELKIANIEDEWQKVGINLIYTFNWAIYRYKHFFKKFDFTFQQYNVLRILRQHHPEPISTSDIRKYMLDHMSDTSRIVERLYRKKLVNRTPNKSDKRLVDVVITEKGKELCRTIESQEYELYSIFKNLSAEEAQKLNELLDKVRE